MGYQARTVLEHGVEGATAILNRGFALLRAMPARHPGQEWHVPPICPEEVGGLFEKAGWKKEPLSQFLMVAELRGDTGGRE